MRNLLVVTALIAAALGVTACSSGDSLTPPETTVNSTVDTTAATTTTAAVETTATQTVPPPIDADLTITIANFAFGGDTEAQVGDTVEVVNNDTVTHTWTAVDGSFNSDRISPGNSFGFTFETAGTFEFFCQIHTSMRGTVTVSG